MTVESTTNKSGPYVATGTGGTFPRPFLLLDEDHLRVIRVRDGVEADITSVGHTGIGEASGEVVIGDGLEAGDQVYLLRAVPNLQLTDYTSQGRVRPDQVETDLDGLVMQLQDITERQGRALTLSVSSELSGEAALQAAIKAPEYAADAMEAALRAEQAALRSVPEYSSRDQLVAALPQLPAGMRVRADGISYLVDPTATGMASAMWDIGADGVTTDDRPANAYVAGFHDMNSPRVIRLYSSTDGLAWRLLNDLPLEADGGTIYGGNPVIAYRDGWFYLLVSYVVRGVTDFRIYKTRDFTTFRQFDCTAGAAAVNSATVPAPGASWPADEIWGAEMVFTPEGQMHVFLTINYGAPTTDAYGLEIGNRRIWRTVCTDLDAMTFSAPSLVLPGGDNMGMIDAAVTRTPGKWVFTVKNEFDKTIRVYDGPSVSGPWTFREVVSNPTYKIEGSCIVPRRLANGSAVWDMFFEGHDTIAENVRSRRMIAHRGATNPSAWGATAATFLQSSVGIRHGTPLNLGFEDPAAWRAFARFGAASAGASVPQAGIEQEMLAGNRSIVPQEGMVYLVTADTGTNLTVLDSPASHFYVACMSNNMVAGINVLPGSAMGAGGFTVGFGCDHWRLVRVSKRSNGKFYAEGGGMSGAFAANKDGASQAVTAGSVTKVTFPAVDFAAGGSFSSSAWTPPAGRYRITVHLAFFGAGAGESVSARILKNGTAIRQSFVLAGSGTQTVAVTAIVTANGSDVFEAGILFDGSGSRTVAGAAENTWFEGAPI